MFRKLKWTDPEGSLGYVKHSSLPWITVKPYLKKKRKVSKNSIIRTWIILGLWGRLRGQPGTVHMFLVQCLWDRGRRIKDSRPWIHSWIWGGQIWAILDPVSNTEHKDTSLHFSIRETRKGQKQWKRKALFLLKTHTQGTNGNKEPGIFTEAEESIQGLST